MLVGERLSGSNPRKLPLVFFLVPVLGLGDLGLFDIEVGDLDRGDLARGDLPPPVAKADLGVMDNVLPVDLDCAVRGVFEVDGRRLMSLEGMLI